MYQVRFCGWREGLRKIPLIDLLRNSLDLGLQPAKLLVDQLLQGEMLSFEFSSEEAALKFAESAQVLGVIASVETFEEREG